MAQDSAIPDNLYRYADLTTSTNTEVATWVRTVLTPAIDNYRRTAIDFGSDIPGITLSATGIPQDWLDQDVLQALRDTLAKDQWVHQVGEGFAKADGGRTTAPVQVAPTELDTLLAQVAQADEKSAADGTALANLVLQDGYLSDDEWIKRTSGNFITFDHVNVLQTLIDHQNDQAFLNAFFNRLAQANPAGLTMLLAELASYITGENTGYIAGLGASGSVDGNGRYSAGLMQALVTAYASGQLSPTAAQMLAHALVISDASPRWLVGDLFTAMAKNPAAAANFMAALSSQDLQTLALDGGMTQAGSDGVMRDVLATATAAVQTGDSDQAHSVFATVTDAFANFYSANPMSDTKAIQDFVSAYVAAIQTAPPYDPDPQKMADELSLWAARQGHNVSDALQPFVTWLKANDSNNAQVQTTTISLVSGIVGTVLTLPFGGVGALAAGTVTTVLQTYVEPTVQSQLLHITPPDPAGDAAALRAAGTAAAKALVAVDLARQGMLIGPDGKPLDLNGPEGAKTLATLLKAGSDYNAIAGWHVKGTDYSLFTVLALVGDQFDGAPNQLPPA